MFYHILSILGGGLLEREGLFGGGDYLIGGCYLRGVFERAGGYLRGGYLRGELIYFLVKLIMSVIIPAQSNVCKTTMHSNNFNTTLNVLRCSTFFNYSTINGGGGLIKRGLINIFT